MADYPNIQVVATADAGFTKEGGMKVMEDFLQRFPEGEIDVVRSDYSDMTMGALEAIKNAGRDELLGYVVGEGGHIKAIEAVVAGEIARETQTPPYFGEKAISSCLAHLNGKAVPAQQQVDIKVFDYTDPAAAQQYHRQHQRPGAGVLSPFNDNPGGYSAFSLLQEERDRKAFHTAHPLTVRCLRKA